MSVPLPVIGVNGQAVEVVLAAGQSMGLRLPFGERAGQVIGDGSAQLRDLHIFVVMLVQQVSGKVLTECRAVRQRGSWLPPHCLEKGRADFREFGGRRLDGLRIAIGAGNPL